MSSGEWYAVRCVLAAERNDPTSGEPPLRYEERITLWRADSFDSAIEMAEVEADKYCADSGSKRLDFAQGFNLFEFPRHGAEVFSLMRDSDLPASSYLDHFFDTGLERQGDVNEP